jgi:hypothetical protein
MLAPGKSAIRQIKYVIWGMRHCTEDARLKGKSHSILLLRND